MPAGEWPNNSSRSFRCGQCGFVFPVDQGSQCPVCGHDCNTGGCRTVDASDEDY